MGLFFSLLQRTLNFRLTQTAPAPPRNKKYESKSSVGWSLLLRVKFWRCLQRVGAWLHTCPVPPPPRPSFTRQIHVSRLSTCPGEDLIDLIFYVPRTYSKDIGEGKRYPLVLNFHGGGFTLGAAEDDGRWAAAVLARTDAVFVSVEYRRAPEHHFPVAVDDCTEALWHLNTMADEYGIDPQKIALSGFSAGGNLVFTVLLRLKQQSQLMSEEPASSASACPLRLTGSLPRVICAVSWYPGLDQRLTRAERRATCIRPDKTLPSVLTNLFDESYMSPSVDKANPLLSPMAASDAELIAALPQDVVLLLCEWDMLFKEGNDFAHRLQKLGKSVACIHMAEARHAFDKSPSPFTLDPRIPLYYERGCTLLKQVFENRGMTDEEAVIDR